MQYCYSTVRFIIYNTDSKSSGYYYRLEKPILEILYGAKVAFKTVQCASKWRKTSQNHKYSVINHFLNGHSYLILFTRREAMLRRVLGFTLIRLYGAFWTVFTRPAITPPKVNRFGWHLESCQPNVGGWPWQTLGVIRAVATVWQGAEKCLFFVR